MSNTRIIWKKEYRIGVDTIDEQHRHLFKMLSDLEFSLPQGVVNPVVGKTLKKIVDYIQNHFRDEEAFMEQIQFPETETHKKAHVKLTNDVKDILLKLKDGGNFTALELMEFLREWVTRHILQEDAQIGKFYSRRIREAMQRPAASKR